eukprot:CFRG1965T1
MDEANRPSDQDILRQTETLEAIQKENPLVSCHIDLSELAEEYKDNSPVFRHKIKDLCLNYKSFRRCRRDGNCLYRAVSYALYEKLSVTKSESLFNRCEKGIHSSKSALIEAGFHEYVFEDFYDMTMDNWLLARENSTEWVHEIFNDDEISNGLGLYYRFMTSAELRIKKEEYAPFLEDGTSIESFCQTQVECFGREADNIQIAALCNFLGISLTIIHLDQTAGYKCNSHNVGVQSGDPFSRIVLLYRPDHYDILYK